MATIKFKIRNGLPPYTVKLNNVTITGDPIIGFTMIEGSTTFQQKKIETNNTDVEFTAVPFGNYVLEIVDSTKFSSVNYINVLPPPPVTTTTTTTLPPVTTTTTTLPPESAIMSFVRTGINASTPPDETLVLEGAVFNANIRITSSSFQPVPYKIIVGSSGNRVGIENVEGDTGGVGGPFYTNGETVVDSEINVGQDITLGGNFHKTLVGSADVTLNLWVDQDNNGVYTLQDTLLYTIYTPIITTTTTTTSGGGGCLVGGQKLIIDSALNTKLIEDIVVGDTVYTAHETSKIFGNHLVTKVTKITTDKLYTVITKTGKLVNCSETHLFMINDVKKKASDLLVTDMLMVANGDGFLYEAIEKIVVIDQPVDVYKIEVENAHTYLTENMIWHHNVKAPEEPILQE